MRRRGLRVSLAAALAAVFLAACASPGLSASSAAQRMPPAAEPAVSRPLATPPTGLVFAAGPHAEGIAVDPATATVAVGDSAGVVLFDESGQVLHRVSLPAGPRHIRSEGPGRPFLVPAEGADEVAFVDPKSGQVEGLVRTGRRPHDLAVVGGKVFIGNELGNSVTVVQGDKVVATHPVVTQPGGLDASGQAVAVVGVRARLLELLDARTLRTIAEVPARTGPSHVASYGTNLYVVDTGGGALLTYATSPRLHQVARLALPGGSPLGMAVDPSRRRLWVTLTGDNTLVEFDLSSPLPRRVATFPTVRQPDSVAVDPNTGAVFVAGEAAGVLEIVHPG
ncbi:MAG: hypothetical protein DLM54_11715 [Acidimicrobiales bacterium]|nr:MAG: hypothetical protein DLM54_11715 [Acidimicrobiales bacterium]